MLADWLTIATRSIVGCEGITYNANRQTRFGASRFGTFGQNVGTTCRPRPAIQFCTAAARCQSVDATGAPATMLANAMSSRNCGTRESGMGQAPMYSAACRPEMSAEVVAPEPASRLAKIAIFAWS